MTDHDVSDSDMPNSPWLSRRDVPDSRDAPLAALLAGTELPAGLSPELRPVADALAALRAAPASDELSGEAQVLAAFRDQRGVPDAVRRPRRRRPTVLAPLLSARAAVIAAAAVLSMGGVATAAYTGALPAPVQRFAHDVFGAPPAGGTGPGGQSSTAPAGPSATASAAAGLCAAWAHAKAHGTAEQKAVAFQRLAAAAGGASHVAAYCAVAAHPGTSASPAASPATPTSHPAPKGSGKPTTHPTPQGSGKPTSHPTPQGSGKPTSHPAPQGSGKPTSHP